MRKYILISLAILTIFGVLNTRTYAADPKLAHTGFQFLSIHPDARGAAMGEALTALPGYSISVFYNPANIAFMEAKLDFSLNRNKWIFDINHYSGSMAFSPWQGRYGIFALSFLSVDYGELQGTIVDPSSQSGYLDTEKFSPSAYAVGVAYSKALSDRFGFGIHLKYVSQDLGSSLIPSPDRVPGDPNSLGTITKSYSEGVLAFDFGTIYRTGFKSLAFGMSVQNYSRELRFESEGFQLPLVFNIGISMDMFDFIMPDNRIHSFLLTVDANHPRAQLEQLKIGGEYSVLNILALRFGYNSNVNNGRDLSFGVGLKKDFGSKGGRIAIDYAYAPFEYFDNNVQRFSFSLSL
jgi:hypothetical protein